MKLKHSDSLRVVAMLFKTKTMKIIREVENVKLQQDLCTGLYKLNDGENTSRSLGSYGGSFYKSIDDESFLITAREEIKQDNHG